MVVNAIAYSYWRRIKDKARMFSSIPNEIKNDVKELANLDLENGTISDEQYQELIGY